MIIPLNVEDADTAQRILELQRTAYRIEADMMETDDIPPMRDNESALKKCGESFYGYEYEGAVIGLVSYHLKEGMLELCRLVVSPSYFRKGIGRQLVEFVLREPSWDLATVCTGSVNEPALSLYKSEGFQEAEELEVSPGIILTRLEQTKADAESIKKPS